jgi:hypothetical protein
LGRPFFFCGFIFTFASNYVQHLAQLLGNALIIRVCHVSVRIHGRSRIAVPQPLLPNLHWNRWFIDVGLRGATVMHLEVLVGLLPKSFERPGPKSVCPATYCSGGEVVFWWRWIVDMRAPFLGVVTPFKGIAIS